ncbi:hypothetical protein CGMCC3_g11971 [Colletotrichum fructicola]|uniref:Uncharacterized protein n=1 Tax=Colletotrichum fructicola (strain Nara gc5) TaxID=1213859 RepID=A0A7J6IN44_COLFN|nr:uncharacterized protein CGMCC3_g11971 [Colletotrichum fructicola]KAE9571846.1 hypothetical protein CGMCC3_g11971 [Colletotrichum fructicola]KAF4428733.1 hypothetical protein CFRS1_v007362 [Colletotrichum fructicola]KAF4478150.1 hypothetical protein CGGC5_v013176 [Colletotrichum fructicola Nara gc5]
MSSRRNTGTTTSHGYGYGPGSGRPGSSSQKKLTPPPQLHERVLLKGQHYRQSQLQPQLQPQSLSGDRVASSLPSSREAQAHAAPHHDSNLQQHLNNQRHQPQQTQHLRVHLRGGHEGQGGVGTDRGGAGGNRGGPRGAPPRNFPYNNSNRDPGLGGFNSSTNQQKFWPEDLRNPRGGLGIDHNLPSPPTPKFEVKRGFGQRTDTPSGDNLDELLPPPSLARIENDGSDPSGSWRPASSIYSLNRDSYTSPVTPNFANVAARNTYSSAVADISPPSSPDLDARGDGTSTQDQSVSPIEDSPNMSQLALEDHHTGQQSTPPKSNIPMMRRERRKNQDAAAHTLRETKSQQRLRIQRETKWDDMTGEPTYLDTGRAGQVRPQEYAQGLTHPTPFGKSPAAMRAMQNAPQAQQTFTDRLRRLRPVGAGNPKDHPKDQQQQPDERPSATATAPVSIDERPPWRGAHQSGRTAIVNPVRDTEPKEPLSIPRRSSRRIAVGPRLPIAGVSSPLSPVSPSGSETSPRSRTPTVRTVLNAPRQLTAGTNAPSPSATRTPPPAQSSYPSPPNSASAGVQSPVLATPEATSSPPVTTRQPAPLPGLPAAPNAHLGQDKAIRRKPPPANSQALHAPQPSYSSSVYSEATTVPPVSTHERSPPRAPRSPGEALKANEPWDQPPSRFSVTTYATSAADQTPRQSTDTAPPPVPALPSPQQQNGVMNRKRPAVLGSTSNAINADKPFVISMSSPYMSSAFPDNDLPAPARSELPSQKQPIPRASNASMYSTSSRPESVWSTSKALPPPPTETSMVNDRVGYLNARLESLGNRRININQAIKQMTELMPTDSILASEAVLRKREAEKRKVEALKVELAEVQREEYEIGLKLHRAYKRMDRNAEYEPTTLWVRRVTG